MEVNIYHFPYGIHIVEKHSIELEPIKFTFDFRSKKILRKFTHALTSSFTSTVTMIILLTGGSNRYSGNIQRDELFH